MTESPTAEEGEHAAKTAAKPEFVRLLELIRGYYRDLLLLAQGAPEALIRNADQLSALRAALGAYPVGELLAALEAVNRCQQFLERNVAPQLALETLFLDLLLPEAWHPQAGTRATPPAATSSAPTRLSWRDR